VRRLALGSKERAGVFGELLRPTTMFGISIVEWIIPSTIGAPTFAEPKVD
jgi:hypothetical protein